MSTKAMFVGLVSSALALSVTRAAQAATFTFDDTDYNQTTIQKTVGGITITVSNPSPQPFYSDFFGLCVFSKGTSCEIDSFDISFSKAVKLMSYNVGFVNNTDSDRALTLSDGISTSIEQGPWIQGDRNFANQFTVDANRAIHVTNSGAQDSDYVSLLSISVSQSVPEPTTVLGVLTLGSLGALARRKCWN